MGPKGRRTLCRIAFSRATMPTLPEDCRWSRAHAERVVRVGERVQAQWFDGAPAVEWQDVGIAEGRARKAAKRILADARRWALGAVDARGRPLTPKFSTLLAVAESTGAQAPIKHALRARAAEPEIADLLARLQCAWPALRDAVWEKRPQGPRRLRARGGSWRRPPRHRDDGSWRRRQTTKPSGAASAETRAALTRARWGAQTNAAPMPTPMPPQRRSIASVRVVRPQPGIPDAEFWAMSPAEQDAWLRARGGRPFDEWLDAMAVAHSR